jgi:hypothetical protein
VVVIDGQQFSLPAVDPLCPGEVLTFRTMPVAAGNGEHPITCFMGSLF